MVDAWLAGEPVQHKPKHPAFVVEISRWKDPRVAAAFRQHAGYSVDRHQLHSFAVRPWAGQWLGGQAPDGADRAAVLAGPTNGYKSKAERSWPGQRGAAHLKIDERHRASIFPWNQI